jgi:hypothetical protein
MAATHCCVTSPCITENTSRDPYTLLCDITTCALYSNDPCADTKKHFHCIVAWRHRACMKVFTELLPRNMQHYNGGCGYVLKMLELPATILYKELHNHLSCLVHSLFT